MDILNRSMTNQYAILQETLRQLQSAYKECYLSSAQSCNGKDPQDFSKWLDDVSQLATVCNKDPIEVALVIARRNLHKFISELVSSGLGCSPIKMNLQERFSECGSVTRAVSWLYLDMTKVPGVVLVLLYSWVCNNECVFITSACI